MIKFLKYTISFILITFLCIGLIFFISSNIVNKKANYKLDNSIKNIILGHSHPECAYNDTLILGFKNLAQSGESYIYTYAKVKKLIEQNPNIENIFIEFTNNQTTKEIDKWIWDDKHISNKFSIYSPFLTTEDYTLLMHKNFSGFTNSFSLSARNNIKQILKKDYNYTKKIGGYLHLNRNKTDSLLNLPDSIYARLKEENVDKSNQNIEYLQKILSFCTEKNKKVYLIRSPQHPKYQSFSNEVLFKQLLLAEFSGYEFLDFNNFPASNQFFGDLEHLNNQGATVFSTWFNQMLQIGLLNKNDKQEFVNRNLPQQDLF